MKGRNVSYVTNNNKNNNACWLFTQDKVVCRLCRAGVENIALFKVVATFASLKFPFSFSVNLFRCHTSWQATRTR